MHSQLPDFLVIIVIGWNVCNCNLLVIGKNVIDLCLVSGALLKDHREEWLSGTAVGALHHAERRLPATHTVNRVPAYILRRHAPASHSWEPAESHDTVIASHSTAADTLLQLVFFRMYKSVVERQQNLWNIYNCFVDVTCDLCHLLCCLHCSVPAASNCSVRILIWSWEVAVYVHAKYKFDQKNSPEAPKWRFSAFML